MLFLAAFQRFVRGFSRFEDVNRPRKTLKVIIVPIEENFKGLALIVRSLLNSQASHLAGERRLVNEIVSVVVTYL